MYVNIPLICSFQIGKMKPKLNVLTIPVIVRYLEKKEPNDDGSKEANDGSKESNQSNSAEDEAKKSQPSFIAHVIGQPSVIKIANQVFKQITFY